MLRKKMIMDRI